MKIAHAGTMICGGSLGMGLAPAQRCVDAGASVIVIGRSENKHERAREALASAARLAIVVADIAQPRPFPKIGQVHHGSAPVCSSDDPAGARRTGLPVPPARRSPSCGGCRRAASASGT
ncbi:hypothetical protein C3L29_030985, partial [Pseudomonas sp. MWU12-2534b]